MENYNQNENNTTNENATQNPQPQDFSQNVNQQNGQQGEYVSYNEGTAPDNSNSKKGYATASLVLGIVSCTCCGFVTAIVGLILGIIFLKDSNEQTDGRGMAIAGVVLSGVGILFTVIGVIIAIVNAVAYGDSSAYTYYLDALNNY